MRVGVIIPVGSFSPFLIEAVQSVLSQSHEPDQVVIVDDGCAEPTQLPIELSAHVTLVRLDIPSGVAAARNAGVNALMDGLDAIAFCDHDDVWEPGYLAAQIDALKRWPTATIVTAPVRIIASNGLRSQETWTLPEAGLHPDSDVIEEVYEAHALCTSATVVRSDALAAAGGFDESLAQAEDLDLWLRLLEAGGDLGVVQDARVLYRRDGAALTQNLAQLAPALLRVHQAHRSSVSNAVAERALAADERGLAQGLIQSGKYAEAAGALVRARELGSAQPSDSLRALLLRLPGLRSLAFRRGRKPGAE